MGERPISRVMERCKSGGKNSTGVIQGCSGVEVGTARGEKILSITRNMERV